MVFILIAGCEIVIAGLAVIIAGLAITISCHEPNFTVDSDETRWGSGEMGMVADEMAVDSDMTTAGMGMAAAGSSTLAADSGLLSAGAILVVVMRDGMGMESASGAIVRVATAQIIAAAGCNCL